jgi:hypothetical protein
LKISHCKALQHTCQLISQSQPIPQNILRGNFVPIVGKNCTRKHSNNLKGIIPTTRARAAGWDIAQCVVIPPTKTPGVSNGHHRHQNGNTMQAQHQTAGILSCILHYMVSKFKMLISSIAMPSLAVVIWNSNIDSEHQVIKEKT